MFNRLGGFQRTTNLWALVGIMMKGGDLEDILIQGNIYGASAVVEFRREVPTTKEFEHIRSHTKLFGD